MRACLAIALALLLADYAGAARADDSLKRLRPSQPYPGYENLVRNYERGQKLVGPGSALDNLITDGKHQPFGGISRLSDARDKLLAAETKIEGSKEKIIKDLIKLDKGSKDDPPLTPKFIDEVTNGLRAMPRSVICLLSSNQCEVHLSPFVLTVEPYLAGQHPSGYGDGDSYDNVGAMFSRGRWLVVAQYRYRAAKRMEALEHGRSVQHEAGHAVDKFLGYPSHSIEFSSAYEYDRHNMSAAQREANRYFMQEGERGQGEIFAELFVRLCGEKQGVKVSRSHPEFVRCYELLKDDLFQGDTLQDKANSENRP